MSQSCLRRLYPAALAACVVITLAAISPARASVISSTPTLPVLGVPYVTSGGAGCFPAVNVCVAPGTLTLTSVVSSTFDGSGQDIVANVLFTNILTTLTNVLIGPISLTGTIEQKVLGRTSADEIGTWETELLALSLSGPVLSRTLSVTLDDTTPSGGVTSIVPLASGGGETQFRIDSFFDVFVELNLDTVPPLQATRGPIRAVLSNEIPEPATLVLLGLGLAGLAWRRRRSASMRRCVVSG